MHGASANDLPPGELGLDPVGVQRKARSSGDDGSGGGSKRKRKLTNACGDAWDADDEFKVRVECM